MQCIFLHKEKLCLGNDPKLYPLQSYSPTEEEMENLCLDDKFKECPRFKEIKEILYPKK